MTPATLMPAGRPAPALSVVGYAGPDNQVRCVPCTDRADLEGRYRPIRPGYGHSTHCVDCGAFPENQETR